jgi:hypothetical protein
MVLNSCQTEGSAKVSCKPVNVFQVLEGGLVGLTKNLLRMVGLAKSGKFD